MKQTENLQLPILQSGDKYTKETQNEAFEKVDLHLGGLAKRVNNIVASGGESNIEIVDARRDNNTGVVYNTLGERIDTVSEQLDTKANKTETANIQQQVNNLVLGAVGDGNNAEVIQARGKHTVLNDRLNSNENDLKNFKDNIGTTTVNRGKNILFLNDQHIESNGLIVDIKDQLITISGQIRDTGLNNTLELDVDMPEVLDGNYSIYVKVVDEQSIAGRNDKLRLRFFNSENVQVAEKIAFNNLSLSGINFSNLSNYKVKLYIQAQYTYKQSWSFNLQLASGHNGIYEKAYVNKDYKLKVDNDITALNNKIKSIIDNDITELNNEIKSIVNNDITALNNDLKNFKDNIGTTNITRGKNILFLKDQHFESNGLTIDIKDQLITVSGQIQSTSFHNYFEFDIDMPKLLDGDYSVYVKVSDGQSISGRNDVLRLRFYNDRDEQVAEKSAFNHLSLTDINFSNLSNYKVKIMILAQYTYTQPWSFNLQLAKGHDGAYEKAYVNKEYKLKVDNEINKVNSTIDDIKNKIGIGDSTNPLANILTDSGLAGVIESYACCGDSLTQGVFDRTNGVTMDFEATKYYSYPSQLSRITGSKVFNLGNAGATACNSQQSISEWHSWLQTANQKKWFTDEFKPKAYIFSIGTNDIGYYKSFTGDVETDIDVNNYNNNDTTTSVGGLATMIQKARELQPKAIIFIETIDNTRNNKTTRDEANEKIRAIAKKLNCYLIDMAKYWIQEDEVNEWMAKYQNGGHLNALGYLLKTRARITYIDWIIKNNPEKFKEVQFIGTTMEYK